MGRGGHRRNLLPWPAGHQQPSCTRPGRDTWQAAPPRHVNAGLRWETRERLKLPQHIPTGRSLHIPILLEDLGLRISLWQGTWCGRAGLAPPLPAFHLPTLVWWAPVGTSCRGCGVELNFTTPTGSGWLSQLDLCIFFLQFYYWK
ncbi:hypothetical protein NDU88_010510 [Pleurodeles waltl]|uniref:Uncharacterized protein n=1 Tax=Pleurodeles waltl TaxID=8319 RepID=A0AAV7Q0C5_PLEWA|nr:hypothetical protein NDU88_010510 [Pleurodeles waltl]